MMSSLNQAVCLLDMSLMAAKHVLHDSPEPLQRRLAWLGSELERLAGEAYRLADEAGDDARVCSCIVPDGWVFSHSSNHGTACPFYEP